MGKSSVFRRTTGCVWAEHQLETQKGQLTQYQRNASYAEEFLNAGQLNLDKLTELNQRAQEIARSAGSSLNGPAMETYGHEINQLIEEALNRINATHRKQALFGGTKLKPKFASTDVMLGKRQTKTFSFNEVGQAWADGKRRIGFGDEMIFSLNGGIRLPVQGGHSETDEVRP